MSPASSSRSAPGISRTGQCQRETGARCTVMSAPTQAPTSRRIRSAASLTE
ncbi:hypothetical protein EVA_09087 [gut metagenome]|uniref:Uncharacterized protein n=1 Tax=gut metagenome TaxID=749906 RepID=J9G7F9_9ZZZZ